MYMDLYGADSITQGATDGTPLTDVSNGAPAEQPYSSTGGGSGYFIDGATLGGMLNKVLDYSLLRDQQQMGVVPVPQYSQAGITQTAAMQKASDKRLLFLGALGLGAFFLLKEVK